MFAIQVAKMFLFVFITNMLKIKINQSKTFLPLEKAHGNTSTRFHIAREMNTKFYESLPDYFESKGVTLTTFEKLLKKLSGPKIGVEVAGGDGRTGRMMPVLNCTLTSEGFLLQIPVEFYTNRVKKSGALAFLEVTQRFFDTIHNPKFFKRLVTINNKYNNPKDFLKFYQEQVNIKGLLDRKTLEQFLKNKSLEEQIDNLQLLRYNLMQERNAKKYVKMFMEKANANPRSDIRYENAANYGAAYQFNEKIKLIETLLKETIQKARTQK